MAILPVRPVRAAHINRLLYVFITSVLGTLPLVLAASSTGAAKTELSVEAVNAAEPSTGKLSSDKATPLGVRLQVLLDRARFSPGEIDGKFGENAKEALRAYAEANQVPSSNKLGPEVWSKLGADSKPVLTKYTVTEKDVSGPFLPKLPAKMEDMKDIPKLSYTSPREALAEKFHMSEDLLSDLNPGQDFSRPGADIVVVDISRADAPHKAARVEVDKDRQTVRVFDESNQLVSFYPATVGSDEKPSPTGTLKVRGISHNPTYHYNPDYHFKGVHIDERFTIRPGPNNPVGTVWIDLSADGYGIHGTPFPAKVSKAESHGCVRLTNWDAEQLAREVKKGTPVEFVDKAT